MTEEQSSMYNDSCVIPSSQPPIKVALRRSYRTSRSPRKYSPSDSCMKSTREYSPSPSDSCTLSNNLGDISPNLLHDMDNSSFNIAHYVDRVDKDVENPLEIQESYTFT